MDVRLMAKKEGKDIQNMKNYNSKREDLEEEDQ